jgi:transcription antitermination factor NusG
MKQNTKLVWRKKSVQQKKEKKCINSITDIVREQGITNIINDYKKQMEELEELKNTIFNKIYLFININNEWSEFDSYAEELNIPFDVWDKKWCDLLIFYMKEFNNFNKKYSFIERINDNFYPMYVYTKFYESLGIFEGFGNLDWSDGNELTDEERDLIFDLKYFSEKIYMKFISK